jgi:hypothetical protein
VSSDSVQINVHDDNLQVTNCTPAVNVFIDRRSTRYEKLYFGVPPIKKG